MTVLAVLVARFGPRTVITVGMLLATVGIALLTGVGPGGSYPAVSSSSA